MSDDGTWATRNVCPECHRKGSAQGIVGKAKWMSCPNGHTFNYEEVVE